MQNTKPASATLFTSVEFFICNVSYRKRDKSTLKNKVQLLLSTENLDTLCYVLELHRTKQKLVFRGPSKSCMVAYKNLSCEVSYN